MKSTLNRTSGKMCPVRSRITRILLMSDSHLLRIILFLAEVLWSYDFWTKKESVVMNVLTQMAGYQTWALIMSLTAIGQLALVLRGKYSSRDAVVFATWDSLIWVFITCATWNAMQFVSSPQIALTFTAAWLFISSGDKPWSGNRETDHA